MSAHNHDEEIIKQFDRKTRLVLVEVPIGKSLQEKVSDAKDEALWEAINRVDVSGMTAEEAKEALDQAFRNAMDDWNEKHS